MKTPSEIAFEDFCRRNHFDLSPVPVGVDKTPDYMLNTESGLVVIEVKEVLPTPEERESDRLVEERGLGTVVSMTPGKTVRQKIKDCSKQIKARTVGKYPGVLLLWEGGLCVGRHTEGYHVRVAMAGFEQFVISLPPLGSGERPTNLGMKHGPKRQMTENDNTSISAVAVLCVPRRDLFLLQVYHNRFAAIPLPPGALRSAEVTQYRLEDAPSRTTEWTEI